jgi:hypothetical protein
MNIEDDLKRALRRQPAPPDFADRVLARIDPQAASAAGRRSHVRQWLAAAAAAALVATGAARYYTYQQSVAEAERINQDIRLALQITSEKLALVQTRVQARVDASLSDSQR